MTLFCRLSQVWFSLKSRKTYHPGHHTPAAKSGKSQARQPVGTAHKIQLPGEVGSTTTGMLFLASVLPILLGTDAPSPPPLLLLCHRRRVLSMLESQSKPSNKPSPLIADVLKIAQSRFLIFGRPSPSATSASDRAPGKSCRSSALIVRKRCPLRQDKAFQTNKAQLFFQKLSSMPWLHSTAAQ